METAQVLENVLKNDAGPQEARADNHGRKELGQQFSSLLDDLIGSGDITQFLDSYSPAPAAPAPIKVREDKVQMEEVRQTEEVNVETEDDLVEEADQESTTQHESLSEQVDVEAEEVGEVEVQEEPIEEDTVVEEQVMDKQSADIEEGAKDLLASTEVDSDGGSQNPQSVAEEVTEKVPQAVPANQERLVGSEDTGEEVPESLLGKENSAAISKGQGMTQAGQNEAEMDLAQEVNKAATVEEVKTQSQQKKVEQPQEDVKNEPVVDEPRRVGIEDQSEAAMMFSVDTSAQGEQHQGAKAAPVAGGNVVAQMASPSGAEGGLGGKTGENLQQGSGTGSFGIEHVKEKLLGAKGKKLGKMLPRNTQDKMIEKVKQALKNASQGHNGKTLVVRMDPPSLGALTVKITHRAGRLFARIIPETAEVETTLRGRVSELLGVLTSNGLSRDNVHVSIGIERSETEMYQFNDFMRGEHGQGNRKRQSEGFRDEGMAEGRHETYTPQASEQAGWVA